MAVNHCRSTANALIVAALAQAPGTAVAAAPFMTDDPVPTDYKHSEFLVFSTYDKARDGKDIAAPAFEYNYGAFPETQLHVGVPFVKSAPNDAPSEFGIGDVEIGIKYRFVQETETIPQVALSPLAVLPTGNLNKGLGNGKTWWRLPIWAQKSWGDWTTYGGGGYVINTAEGRKDYAFGGWLLQKDFGEKWTLGGEVFARGKDTIDGQATTIVNFGGLYKFTPDFNLLFSGGRDVGGERHTVAYLGLRWAFGGDHKGEQKAGAAPRSAGWALAER